jgi:hypothetical protein
MDVSDHYVKVSDQQPLVGGWEPIHTYYTRLRDAQTHLAAADHDALKRYSVA